MVRNPRKINYNNEMTKGSLIRKAAEEVYGADKAQLAIRSYDIIGDIAIIKIPDELLDKRFEFAEKIIEYLKGVSTVFRQKSPIRGSYRLRELEFLAGEYKTLTIHKEYGCRFYVDVLKTYFTPRLSTERWRITNLVNNNEIIVNMFAGVGPYSILIAKYREIEKVFSIDINYEAYRLHKLNVSINKVYDRVNPILGDAGEIISHNLVHIADRVIMPLPELALEYLKYAIMALKNEGYIHIYLHIPYVKKEKEALYKACEVIRSAIHKHKIISLETHRVREVSTRTLQVCVDIKIEK